MHALLSDDNNFVHGAMRVLTEFSSEVTHTQIPQVAPIILPQMCLILTEDTVQYTCIIFVIVHDFQLLFYFNKHDFSPLWAVRQNHLNAYTAPPSPPPPPPPEIFCTPANDVYYQPDMINCREDGGVF